MREFFRGWKRKVGSLTSILALIGVAAWVRTTTFSDSVRLEWRDSVIVVSSIPEGVLVVTCETERRRGFEFWSRPVDEQPSVIYLIDWRWRVFGFGFGRIFAAEPTSVVFLPFGPTIGSMTLLSVWLFLSAPRPQLKSPVSHA